MVGRLKLAEAARLKAEIAAESDALAAQVPCPVLNWSAAVNGYMREVERGRRRMCAIWSGSNGVCNTQVCIYMSGAERGRVTHRECGTVGRASRLARRKQSIRTCTDLSPPWRRRDDHRDTTGGLPRVPPASRYRRSCCSTTLAPRRATRRARSRPRRRPRPPRARRRASPSSSRA